MMPSPTRQTAAGRQQAKPAASGEPDPSRRNNLALITALVHHHGVLSRAQLTKMTGLNRSTVGTLIGQLVALGLVYETRPQVMRSRWAGQALMCAPAKPSLPCPSTPKWTPSPSAW
ncbi:hypothetical protein AHiyo6_22660 [Arthrobacter sp. Hiyo6]|nr:hypothetical protein AHiyo6_22660 [Arthrobacter sp. Hiyo6]